MIFFAPISAFCILRSVLTTRLKRLVEAGILDHEPYQQEGARTRFTDVLSTMGRDLGLTILALMQWGDEHLKGGVPALEISAKESGIRSQSGERKASRNEESTWLLQLCGALRMMQVPCSYKSHSIRFGLSV